VSFLSLPKLLKRSKKEDKKEEKSSNGSPQGSTTKPEGSPRNPDAGEAKGVKFSDSTVEDPVTGSSKKKKGILKNPLKRQVSLNAAQMSSSLDPSPSSSSPTEKKLKGGKKKGTLSKVALWSECLAKLVEQ